MFPWEAPDSKGGGIRPPRRKLSGAGKQAMSTLRLSSGIRSENRNTDRASPVLGGNTRSSPPPRHDRGRAQSVSGAASPIKGSRGNSFHREVSPLRNTGMRVSTQASSQSHSNRQTQAAPQSRSDKHVPTATASHFRVSFADEKNPGFRRSMEDEHRIVEGFNNDPGAGFFAVYDGHGGRDVVEVVKARLDTNLLQAINNRGHRSMESAIVEAYAKTNAQCNRCDESGSTAATALVVNEEGHSRHRRMLYAANVGDSRVVLCENSVARRMTFDHKASDDSEADRVSDMGGFVIMNRVMGVLAVSRSFGDKSLQPYVTAEPYVSSVQLGRSHPFMIIACDGVWDVMSDQEAVDMVLKTCGTSTRVQQQQKVAEVLVQAALEKGSRDNITAMVVYFQ